MKTWVPRYEQIAHLSPDEKLRSYKRSKQIMDAIPTLVAFAFLITLFLVVVFRSINSLPEGLEMPVLFSPVIIGIFLFNIYKNALNDNARGILCEQWHEPQVFTALIEFACFAEGNVYIFRHWALDNLNPMFPLLQDSQYTLLSAGEKRKLYSLITVHSHPNFLLTALDMLERFADVEALPTVRNVAAAATFTPEQREVRRRAQQCVAFLEARLQEKTLAQSLLRGSDANANASDILLRAAEGQETPEAERHELLRANVQQQSEKPLS